MVASPALAIRPQGPPLAAGAAIEVSRRVNADKPSKSARKREHLALQDLGEKLTLLGPSELDALPLDERLMQAVIEARHIRSHSALRRQRQLIGKLMRTADAAEIRLALERQQRSGQDAKRLFHGAETWRDRICEEGGPAIAAFAAGVGGDARPLEALLGEFRAAGNDERRRSIRRRIFREVHEVLLGRSGDSETK